VKFIRFAQWRIQQTGYGILGFVTNHGYLENTTFRGMRQALMQDFDEIYILDLHGNSKKKEFAPDGSIDNNVFDIQQGVAIGIFVKYREPKKRSSAGVYHAHLHGKRALKYQYLMENSTKTTQWTKLQPQAPHYLFAPQNRELLAEYEQGWKVTEMMPVNSVGIVTARDSLTIHQSPHAAMRTLKDFIELDTEKARLKYNLGVDTRDWKVALAQNDIKEHGLDRIMPVLYRPFDTRFTCYTGKSRGFICMPRTEVMQHMLQGENLGLLTTRKVEAGTFGHALVTEVIAESHAVSLKEINYLFPLFLYPSKKTAYFADNDADIARKPNFSPEFIKDVETRLNLQFIVEDKGDFQRTISALDIFHYAYAIFHSPRYRQRYAEFLKIDFPRLPLTRNKALFQQLADLGEKLVEIHLMKADLETETHFPIVGNNIVDKVAYKENRVYINKTQYFDNVKSEVWEFQIGGYQVCQKWLKDRKGQALSYDDCMHYFYILSALAATQELMKKSDTIIPTFPF
jgi:predicted helicase